MYFFFFRSNLISDTSFTSSNSKISCSSKKSLASAMVISLVLLFFISPPFVDGYFVMQECPGVAVDHTNTTFLNLARLRTRIRQSRRVEDGTQYVHAQPCVHLSRSATHQLLAPTLCHAE